MVATVERIIHVGWDVEGRIWGPVAQTYGIAVCVKGPVHDIAEKYVLVTQLSTGRRGVAQ